jgi:hypothetical protein
VAPFAFFLPIAGLVVWRRPQDRMALLFALMLVTNGAIMTRATQMVFATRPWTQPFALAVWLLGAVSVALFLVSFPTGRITRRWTLAAPLAGVAGFVVYPRSVEAILYLPELPEAAGRLRVAAALGMAMFTVGVAAQVQRYRRDATSLQRQQIKWAVFPLGLLLAVGTFAGTSLIVGPDARLFGVVVIAMMAITLLLPVAWAKALLRHRLYEIDRIISRTVTYGLVVALLGAVYAGGVVGMGAAVSGVWGRDGDGFVVAVTTLAAVALFHPLRRGVQARVDRRFNRSGYAAHRAVDGFTERSRDAVDLAELRRVIERTTAEAVQPVSVSMCTVPAPDDSPTAERRP